MKVYRTGSRHDHSACHGDADPYAEQGRPRTRWSDLGGEASPTLRTRRRRGGARSLTMTRDVAASGRPHPPSSAMRDAPSQKDASRTRVAPIGFRTALQRPAARARAGGSAKWQYARTGCVAPGPRGTKQMGRLSLACSRDPIAGRSHFQIWAPGRGRSYPYPTRAPRLGTPLASAVCGVQD